MQTVLKVVAFLFFCSVLFGVANVIAIGIRDAGRFEANAIVTAADCAQGDSAACNTRY